MFLFASRKPIVENSTKEIEKVLCTKPESRLVLALFDADDRYRVLAKQHENLTLDNSSRLEVIEKQGNKIVRLEEEVDRWLDQSRKVHEERNVLEAERNELQFRMKDLSHQFENVEKDREDRLKVIQQQGKRICSLEAEVDRWLDQSKKLHEERNVLEAERNELQFRIKDLSHQFENVEKDREDRLKLIQQQGKRMSSLEAEVDRWLEQSKKLQEERNQQDERISDLETELNRWLDSRIYYFLRLLRLDRIFLKKKYIIKKQPTMKHPRNSGEKFINRFQEEIDHFNESQSNKELLNDIREFNHQIIDDLNSIVPLNGALLLDIGASPHGYALERALYHNVSLYVGIGLDIKKAEHVIGDNNNNGLLMNMDATSLKFPDDMFDAVFSASTFEHIQSVSKALTEIHRILKKRGYALITFEPVWSYSRGHHLHHFGECSELIPPWAHLEWSPEQMKRFLADKWPINSPIPLEKAIDWIYLGQELNRLNIKEFRNLFETSPLKIEWMVNLKDNGEKYDPTVLKKFSEMTGLSPEDLIIKGISVLLKKDC